MADGPQVAKTVETTETVQSVDAAGHGMGEIPSVDEGPRRFRVARKFGKGGGRKSDEGRWSDDILMAYGMNLKGIVDDNHHLSYQASLRSQDLQEKINSQFLESAANNAALVNRRGQNAATIDGLIGTQGLAQNMQNAALGASVIEQARSAAKQIIDTAASVAAVGAGSAVGTTMLTTPPAQGATGLAQAVGQETLTAASGNAQLASAYAGLQAQLNAVYNSQQATLNAILQNAESNSALLQINKALGDSIVQIATNSVETNKALAVLLVEVTGKAVVAPITPAAA